MCCWIAAKGLIPYPTTPRLTSARGRKQTFRVLPQRAELDREFGPSLRVFEWREALIYIPRYNLLVHLSQCDVYGGMVCATRFESEEPLSGGAFRVVLD